jgi:hypothetical protein
VPTASDRLASHGYLPPGVTWWDGTAARDCTNDVLRTCSAIPRVIKMAWLMCN